MKAKYFIIPLLTLLLSNGYSQVFRKNREYGIHGSGVLSQFGYGFSIGANRYMEKLNLDFSLLGELATIENVGVKTYNTFITGSYPFFVWRNRFYASVGVGVMGNLYQIDPIFDETTSQEGFNYGPVVLVNLEMFVFNKLAVFTEGKHIQFINHVFKEPSGLRGRAWYLNVGVKYIIN